MLLAIESAKAIDQVCRDLEKAVVEHKFGVLTVHNLKETMKKKTLELKIRRGAKKIVKGQALALKEIKRLVNG